MTLLEIILLALAALLVLFFLGGLLGARARARAGAPAYARHLGDADQALEQARAADRGWDPQVMEDVARTALAREYPDRHFERLELVLVDDRPGVNEDKAHFEASDGQAPPVRVVLGRDESGWVAEQVG